MMSAFASEQTARCWCRLVWTYCQWRTRPRPRPEVGLCHKTVRVSVVEWNIHIRVFMRMVSYFDPFCRKNAIMPFRL